MGSHKGKKDMKYKNRENAYFTVEAALVVPIVISTMLFVIYMLLFQYNRCLLEQDLGAMMIWGSSAEIQNEKLFEEKMKERMQQMYREKYAAWEITTLNMSLQQNNFTVKGDGQLTFPLSGWNFWSRENIWSTGTEYSCRRLSPVSFIRLCRKTFHNREAKGSEDGEQ